MEHIQFQSNSEAPHVVMSVRNDRESRLAAVRSGAAADLVKPVDISTLVEQLDSITHRSNEEPYRVLLVDNDKSLADYYVQMLTSVGMTAMAINSPSQLFAALSGQQPEIMLMDLYMPECR